MAKRQPTKLQTNGKIPGEIVLKDNNLDIVLKAIQETFKQELQNARMIPGDRLTIMYSFKLTEEGELDPVPTTVRAHHPSQQRGYM